MDTNFEAPASSFGQGPSAGLPAEVVFEAPRFEDIPQADPGIVPEIEEDHISRPFEEEAESIMDIPGTPHDMLEALAGGKVETLPKTPLEEIEEASKKQSKQENKSKEVFDETLEEKVLKLQQLVLTMMLMQMNKEKPKEGFSSKELVSKIRQLIEEAEDSRDKSPQIMTALMGMLMMAFAISEKGADSLEKQLGAN